jgi:hypothetical protein
MGGCLHQHEPYFQKEKKNQDQAQIKNKTMVEILRAQLSR